MYEVHNLSLIASFLNYLKSITAASKNILVQFDQYQHQKKFAQKRFSNIFFMHIYAKYKRSSQDSHIIKKSFQEIQICFPKVSNIFRISASPMETGLVGSWVRDLGFVCCQNTHTAILRKQCTRKTATLAILCLMHFLTL